jgi:hypothetical protein
MIRIPLESATVPGFARALTAEELDYHAPVPDVTRALVIRSEHADRFAAWETAPVPNDLVFTDTVAFVVLAAIEATDDRREFTLAIDGLPVLTITNPRTAREGVLEWTGDDGVRAELHVTLVDRYSDAMGFLFVHVPRRFLRPGEPLRFELRGETAGTRTWCMIFERSVSPEITVRPVPAVVRAPGGPLQELRVDIVRLDEGGPVTLDSPAGQAEAMTTLGHTRLLLEIPAVDRRTSVSIAFELENERPSSRSRSGSYTTRISTLDTLTSRTKWSVCSGATWRKRCGLERIANRSRRRPVSSGTRRGSGRSRHISSSTEPRRTHACWRESAAAGSTSTLCTRIS